MADKEQIAEAIKRLTAEQVGATFADVTPDVTFGSLGFDSLDDIELVMAVEDEFGIELPDEALDNLGYSRDLTIQAFIDFVAARVPA